MNNFLLLIIMLCYLSQASSQGNKNSIAQRPCPKFIIESKKGKKLEKYFTKKYSSDLSKKNVIYKPLWIKKDVFYNLIVRLKNRKPDIIGFRVYLAQDLDEIRKDKNSLKFIFTGLTKDMNDTKEYFIVDSGGKNINVIDSKTADSFVLNYQTNTLPYIKGNIKDTNTKSYAFFWESQESFIDSLIKELDKQNNNRRFSGIKIKLGAYYNEEYTPDTTKYSYKDRLMIGFIFTKNDGDTESNIDRRWGTYGCRILPRKRLQGGISADTGTPCPPNSCNGTTLGH